jgi:purine-binding chemotaxis protein CheW
MVIFRVGAVSYALAIEAVQEILATVAITPVADAPGGMAGIASVRGRVVPVFDLHWKLGVATGTGPRQLILVDHDSGTVGLTVDAVEEVAAVPREAFQPVRTPGQQSALGYLLGCFQWGERIVLWVDHNRLVPAAVARAA